MHRRELYKMVWSEEGSQLCAIYDINEKGLEAVCDRLNIPYPEKAYWKKLHQGKKSDWLPLQDRSKGTDKVVFYKRNEELQETEHLNRINALKALEGNLINKINAKLEPLTISTRDAFKGDQETRWKYRDKNKLLAIHVSPECECRALLIMDLAIKVLRYHKHNVIIDESKTYAIVEEEKIAISIGEKNRRVEYQNEYGREERELHPTGLLYFRVEAGYWIKKDWKDGRLSLEDQVQDIINDMARLAQQLKDDRAESEKRQREREEQQRIEDEFKQRQRKELALFRQLLFEAHRFSVSTMLRTYIDHIERQAMLNDKLDDQQKEWISWARDKAAWFDPSSPDGKKDILNGIDIESLKMKDSYTGFNYYSQGSERTQDSFWKPWWSR